MNTEQPPPIGIDSRLGTARPKRLGVRLRRSCSETSWWGQGRLHAFLCGALIVFGMIDFKDGAFVKVAINAFLVLVNAVGWWWSAKSQNE